MKSNRNFIIVIGIIVVVLAGAAIVAFLTQQANKSKNTQVTEKQQPLSPEQNAENPTAAITIVYTDKGFDPSTYMAKVGDAIAVVNNSQRSLQFASNDHPTHLKEPELNIGVLQPGQSGTFIVTKAGTWGFHDHLRSDITGTLTVVKK